MTPDDPGLTADRWSMTIPGRRRGSQLGALAIVALVAIALPLPASGAKLPGPEGATRLSDERTETRWAHPERVAPIRRSPTARAKSIAPTHLLTEDGFPEVYLVLRSWTNRDGHTWLEVRIPMRPNGRKGWVRKSALGPLYRVRTHLVVDRSKQRATLYKRGRQIWRAPVGIGAPGTPTPTGRFWVREKFKTSNPDGLYGPAAIGTSNYSVLSDWPGGGVIGIHGTNEPKLIPGRPSHGCIRVRNRAVLDLYRLLPIGTPLRIRR